jgi:hypothetical protein
MKSALRLMVLCMIPSFAHGEWPSLPTYDWVPDDPSQPSTLGVQRPPSTEPGGLLEGLESHGMRAHMVSFALLVPLADLQAALPPGFTAGPSAPGANTSVITLVFVLGQQSHYVGYGTAPPLSYAMVVAPAFNTALYRIEMLLLALELPIAPAVELSEIRYGAGVARLAEIEEEVESGGGTTRFRLKVKDEGLGLDVRAEASCPYPIDVRAVTDVDPRIFRFVAGQALGRAFMQAVQWDYRIVSVQESGAKVVAKGGYLHLPGGSIRLLAVVGNVTFNRNSEFYRGLLE